MIRTVTVQSGADTYQISGEWEDTEIHALEENLQAVDAKAIIIDISEDR